MADWTARLLGTCQVGRLVRRPRGPPDRRRQHQHWPIRSEWPTGDRHAYTTFLQISRTSPHSTNAHTTVRRPYTHMCTRWPKKVSHCIMINKAYCNLLTEIRCSASEMTYIVSSGALNSTHSLLKTQYLILYAWPNLWRHLMCVRRKTEICFIERKWKKRGKKNMASVERLNGRQPKRKKVANQSVLCRSFSNTYGLRLTLC